MQLNVGDYADVSQFVVKSVWRGDGDVILGLAWIETLETFTLNAENKFLTFSYKKKKLKLHDATMKPKAPSLEDFKHISKVISLENQKSIQKMQKDFDKVITDKNEGISRLKDHNKKLRTHIKKSQKIENNALRSWNKRTEISRRTYKKNEENSRSKNRNQGLLEHTRKLKEEKLENPDININESDNEELPCLRNRNQILLTQIKPSLKMIRNIEKAS